jgi:AcrR family transcriptional regulator
LLSKQAPGEITRASLARHANVDPGLIRYYFKNRDVLMRMVATQLTETLGARGLARAKPEESTPADLVSARAQTLLDFKLENPFYHHLMMEMAQSEDGESRALYHKIAGRAIERYREYLTAGQKDRTLRKVDEAFLYIAIVGLCDFFVIASPVLAPYLGKRTPERIQKDYGAFITDLILNGIRPR